MPWYDGESVAATTSRTSTVGSDRNLVDFRLPVQYVDLRPRPDFRGFAGQVASGVVRPGDEVLVLPSVRTTRVRAILTSAATPTSAFAPMSVTVTLEDDIDVRRGDMLVHPRNLPTVAARASRRMVVWMAEEPLRAGPALLDQAHDPDRAGHGRARLEYRVDVNTLSRMAPAGRSGSTRSAASRSAPPSRSSSTRTRRTGPPAASS